MPVTTGPAPRIAKDRSTHSRGRPRSAAGGVRSTRRSRAARSSSSPDAGRHVDRHDLGALEEGPVQPVGYLQRRQLALVVVDQAHLRQGHDAPADAQQLQDAEVLLGLRLPTLGGGHHEQAGVDRARRRPACS